jgi:PAS domain S-box-containing protein
MFGRILDYFLENYREREYVEREKAKAFIAIFLLTIVILLPSLTYSLSLSSDRRHFFLIVPLVGLIFCVFLVFFKKGYYVFTSHATLVFSLGALWVVIFFAESLSNIIEKLDTLILVLAILTAPSLVIVKRRIGIILYFAANIVMFAFFMLYLATSSSIGGGTLTEYAIDVSIALVVAGIISYQSFVIHRGAIRRAEDEAEKNKDLNRILQESESRYRTIREEMKEGYYETDLGGNFTFLNQSFSDITGYPLQEILGSNYRDYGDENITGAAFDVFHKVFETGKSMRAPDWKIKGRDGKYRFIELSVSLIADASGSPKGFRGVIRDITDRKNAEIELRVSEEKYRSVVENASILIVIIQKGLIQYVNPMSLQISGYSPAEMAGRSITDLIHPLDHPALLEMYSQNLQGNRHPGRNEYRAFHRDGSMRWIVISGAPITWNSSPAILYFVTDITRIKAAEEQMHTSLREKETLLCEVHHRVKNNFQIIISLINLQSRKIVDPALLALYTETQNRIRAMSLIHENLYRAGTFSGINFGAYLKTLMENLRLNYSSTDQEIELRSSLEDIELGIDQAIPCGLIINEILTNCFKHAFPPGFKGPKTIEVSLLTHAGDMVELRVADNGVGLPDGITPGSAGTLGMSLISTLAVQAKGTISVENNGGTRFAIHFKLQ